ncbi:MAG: hypothetical protein H5T69_18280 [Chloroflexi bacterium]|nr:hypothetical protein [Chloroflexota bacterium]
MTRMTMRNRILAVVQGREHDRVPLVIYEGILPVEDVRRHLGRERIGLLRWSRIHREEHPHCRFETKDYWVGGRRWQRNTLYTPIGSIYEERAFETAYESSSIRKHYIQEPQDYEVFWAYLQDSVVLEDYERYYRDQAELGEDGTPLVAVERTPYQQLWVQWVGLDTLGYHFADYPDRVAHTIELLRQRARRIFELAARSPAPFIDFPDNITAPAIGPKRFREYCVPLYNELADMLGERPVFVHMDGDLKPLWQAIAESRVRGLDSFAPAPDNDTTVAQAVALWPEMRLFVNFPSSVHLQPTERVRAEAEAILAAAGHTGRLQIQISENVPLDVWRTSLPAIAEAIEAFGRP